MPRARTKPLKPGRTEAPDVAFFVPGVPAPGGSKKAFRHARTGNVIVLDDAKGNREWKQRVAIFAGLVRRSIEDGPLRVRVRFYVARPKGHFGTGRNAGVVRPSAPAHPTTRPDATKLWRAAEDACTGVVWLDDAQIVQQDVSKSYAPEPGVYIEVWRL